MTILNYSLIIFENTDFMIKFNFSFKIKIKKIKKKILNKIKKINI